MKKMLAAASATAAITAALIAPAADAANVGVGQSGWFWGNPQPQGNTLHAVEFAGGVGYAAGDFGTLLRTADGGATWTGVPTGITSNLTRIRAVDANTVVLGAGCILRRSDDGGQTFKRVPFTNSETNCPATLQSFAFPTPLVGYLVLNDGTVQTTTDGGQTFGGVTAVPGTQAGAGGGNGVPSDIWFTSPTTGFVTVGGNVYRTTDGGNSWIQKFAGGAALNSMYFSSPTVGYAVGKSGALIKTVDGGDTWTAMPLPVDVAPTDFTQIRCAPTETAQTCLISTAAGDKALRTTDGGTTITPLTVATRPIFALAFASPSGAIGVGDAGTTIASPDAGTDTATPSFTTVGSRLFAGDVALGQVRATNATVVHATGDNGKLARSVDGGKTWTRASVPTSEDLTDVSFVDAGSGFSIDDANVLRYTADGGSRWTSIDTGTVGDVSAVHAIDKNIVLLFTGKGIFRSTAASNTSNPGTTFEAIDNSKLQKTSFDDFDVAGSAIVGYGTNSIWLSTNKGAKWTAVKGPVKKPRYQNVDFTSSKVGYAVTTDGRVWKTTNGGKKWAELLTVGTNDVNDMAFGDAKNGFLTIGTPPGAPQGGWVLRTSDGGASWRPQLVAQQPIESLEAPSSTAAFALSGAGDKLSDLFGTTTGGDQGDANTVTVKASATKLKKAGSVKLTVKVSPSVIGANVVLLKRGAKSPVWSTVSVPGGALTKGSGTYTVTVKVKATTYFVAQWRGDADRNGDGSPVTAVTIAAKKKKK